MDTKRDGSRADLKVSGAVPVREMDAIVGTNFLPEPLRTTVNRNLSLLRMTSWLRCAAHEYRMAAAGHTDLLFYNKLMPWDHAAGWLLHQEAGATAPISMWIGAQMGPRLIRPSFLLDFTISYCNRDDFVKSGLKRAHVSNGTVNARRPAHALRSTSSYSTKKAPFPAWSRIVANSGPLIEYYRAKSMPYNIHKREDRIRGYLIETMSVSRVHYASYDRL